MVMILYFYPTWKKYKRAYEITLLSACIVAVSPLQEVGIVGPERLP
jgi:hypothetical protein